MKHRLFILLGAALILGVAATKLMPKKTTEDRLREYGAEIGRAHV